MTGARLLFLDDSGKPDANHASKAVVVGGFAIDADLYPTLSRRVLGAKASHFAKRGQPQAWELKSSMLVKPNPWKRATNRRFCDEVARILGSIGATVFSTTLDKSRLKHPMALTTSMPLQLQSLVEHFDVECKAMSRVGMVVSDWSNHFLDQHASQCVASFAAAKRLAVHPAVYYASSQASEGVQVADLIAAVQRRVAEGDASLEALTVRLHANCATPSGITVKGRPFTNRIMIF